MLHVSVREELETSPVPQLAEGVFSHSQTTTTAAGVTKAPLTQLTWDEAMRICRMS
jgi:hypothetical protein